jgi:hypothetical protein
VNVAITTEGDLLVILLTGGGLALLGTVLGALITQVFTAAAARQSRREARRVALKTFQRDTLVALQDNVVAMNVLFRDVSSMRGAAEQTDAEYREQSSRYRAATMQVRMLASRVRDTELREAVEGLLHAHDKWLKSDTGIAPADVARSATDGMAAVLGRAGHLIRTMDELEEAETESEGNPIDNEPLRTGPLSVSTTSGRDGRRRSRCRDC